MFHGPNDPELSNEALRLRVGQLRLVPPRVLEAEVVERDRLEIEIERKLLRIVGQDAQQSVRGPDLVDLRGRARRASPVPLGFGPRAMSIWNPSISTTSIVRLSTSKSEPDAWKSVHANEWEPLARPVASRASVPARRSRGAGRSPSSPLRCAPWRRSRASMIRRARCRVRRAAQSLLRTATPSATVIPTATRTPSRSFVRASRFVLMRFAPAPVRRG